MSENINDVDDTKNPGSIWLKWLLNNPSLLNF